MGWGNHPDAEAQLQRYLKDPNGIRKGEIIGRWLYSTGGSAVVASTLLELYRNPSENCDISQLAPAIAEGLARNLDITFQLIGKLDDQDASNLAFLAGRGISWTAVSAQAALARLPNW